MDKRKRLCSRKAFWTQPTSFSPDLSEALAAIYGFVVPGHKRHLGLFAAPGTNRGVGDSLAAALLFGHTAVAAPDGVIGKTLLGKKLLLTRGKNKLCSTVAAHEHPILIHVQFPRFVLFRSGVARLTWSLPPHPPAGRFAPKNSVSPLLLLSGAPLIRFSIPNSASFLAGLTSKPHHAHRNFCGLRGSFCLRLASIFNHRPGPAIPFKSDCIPGLWKKQTLFYPRLLDVYKRQNLYSITGSRWPIARRLTPWRS